MKTFCTLFLSIFLFSSSSLNAQLRTLNTGNVVIGNTTLNQNGYRLYTAGHVFQTGKLILGHSVAKKPGGGVWIATSDQRLKKNIKSYKDGLEQILQINPVTYQYNGKAGIEDTETEYVGVLAQDISKVAPYMIQEEQLDQELLVSESIGDNQDGESGKLSSYLSVDASSITYMLINAVKEQNLLIEKLESTLNSHNSKLHECEKIIARLEEDCCSSKLKNDSEEVQSASLESFSEINFLGQNRPNPLNESTIINYKVVSTAQNAVLNFMTANGQIIKSVNLNIHDSRLDLDCSSLNSGSYFYQLVVDGNPFETKKMIVVK